jgi:hypothetical protein
MKKNFLILFLLVSCGYELPVEQEFPILKTLEVLDIDDSGVTFRGELIRMGKSEISSYGFVWDVYDPDNVTSNKVVVGSSISLGSFEKRINNGISNGIKYQVRAFVIYSNKTVYGNPTIFESKSNKSQWSLGASGIDLEGNTMPLACTDNKYGYVIFQGSELFLYDSKENKFIAGTNSPMSGDLFTIINAASGGNSPYIFFSGIPNLYRLDKGSWSFQSNIPLSLITPFNYYYCLQYSNKVYFLSALLSAIYDIENDLWIDRKRIPINQAVAIAGVTNADKAFVLTSDKNIWEYNLIDDTWSKRTVYPGKLRSKIVSFFYDNKLYFGLSYGNFSNSDKMERGFWSYDLANDQWQIQEVFPGNYKYNLFHFFLNNKLYMGHGNSSNPYDLWVFDPAK